MGNVVSLPLRGTAGDIDTLMELAALMVGAYRLVSIASMLAPDATEEITLNGERRRITKAEGIELARDILRQRKECLAPLGNRTARWLLAEVERTLALVCSAEGAIRKRAG